MMMQTSFCLCSSSPCNYARICPCLQRWFELLQATEHTPASFVYYETEPKPGDAPRGVIVLNLQSVLMSSKSLATEKNPYVFAVSSQQSGIGGKTITTTLAAESQAELDMWTAAIGRALHSFKPKDATRKNMSQEEKALHKRTAPQLRCAMPCLAATPAPVLVWWGLMGAIYSRALGSCSSTWELRSTSLF